MPIVFEGKRNVFEANTHAVVCTVNLVGVMGAGVAKEYARRFPEAFSKYKIACGRGDFTIGKVLVQRLNNGQIGVCLPTKVHWKNPSQVQWIEAGLQRLLVVCERANIQSLAITPLGCANGQLNYREQVRPLMFHYLEQVRCPVSICL